MIWKVRQQDEDYLGGEGNEEYGRLKNKGTSRGLQAVKNMQHMQNEEAITSLKASRP